MILVGWVARWARHARRAAAARVLAVPREIVVRLAHPPDVAAAGALHFTPQDRRLSHLSPRDQPPPHVLGDLELGNRRSLRRLLICRVCDAEEMAARAHQ